MNEDDGAEAAESEAEHHLCYLQRCVVQGLDSVTVQIIWWKQQRNSPHQV